MIPKAICAACFLIVYIASRRSLRAGVLALLCVGYAYGILRAQASLFGITNGIYFVFDSAVIGLYMAQLFKKLSPEERIRTNPIRRWVLILMLLPILMFLIPSQNILVRMVGLRGHIFFLPFLLLGARLTKKDILFIARGLLYLNILALVFAIAEFCFGVERFIPFQEGVTSLIYTSTTDKSGMFLRIPSTFVNASAYGATMFMTMPFLIGLWSAKPLRAWQTAVIALGSFAAILGILMSATRTNFVALSVLLSFILLMIPTRFIKQVKIGLIALLVIIGFFVYHEERFQRFTTLSHKVMHDRFKISVNESFLELMRDYPFGNGLGGGGTSIPYFLKNNVIDLVMIENEYGRIMLEQTIFGLFLWLAFIIWLCAPMKLDPLDPWMISRRLARVSCLTMFALASIGTGLLTSIPFTVLFLLTIGWFRTPYMSQS